MYDNKFILELCSEFDYMDMNLTTESFLQEMKNLSDSELEKAASITKKNMKVVEKYLKDHHVDISFLKKQAKKMEKVALNAYKKGDKPDQAALKAVNTIGKETIKKSIAAVKKYYGTVTLKKAVLNSLFVFIIVITVNTFFGGLFSTIGFLSGLVKLGEVLSTVVLAPLVEETAKKYAIDQDYPFVYTTIFSGLEGVIYVARMVRAGINLPLAVGLRVVGILFHFSTLLIQIHFKKKSIRLDDERYDMLGFMVAFFMHATWNGMCILPELLS